MSESKNNYICSRSRPPSLGIWLLLLLLSSGCGDQGRSADSDVRFIDDCVDDCPLGIEHVSRIGSIDDPVTLPLTVTVTRHTDGTFLVGPLYEPGAFAVYSADGSFVRKVGRAGDGPGELGTIKRILVARDSVYVVTRGLVHVFSETLEYVRRFPAGYLWNHGFGVTRDGLIVNSIQVSPEGQIQGSLREQGNVHMISFEDGSSLRSWSASQWVDANPANPYSAVAAVAATGEESFALASFPSYEVTRITSSGPPERFQRRTEWFQPWLDDDDDRDPTGRNHPRIMSLDMLRDGRLLSVVLVAAEDAPDEDEIPPDHDFDQDPTPGYARWDSRIEILNLDSGRVEATALRDELIQGMASDSLLYSRDFTRTGLFVVDLWQINPLSP